MTTILIIAGYIGLVYAIVSFVAFGSKNDNIHQNHNL